MWTPVLDGMFSTEIERGNLHDEYAVVLILDSLLLVESQALLVIVLCGICESSLGRFLGRPTGRFGVAVVRAATVRDTSGRSGPGFKLVGDRCHGTTHLKVTLSLFRKPPPNNLSCQWPLRRKNKLRALGAP